MEHDTARIMADNSYHFFNNKEKAKKYFRVNEENIQKSTFLINHVEELDIFCFGW